MNYEEARAACQANTLIERNPAMSVVMVDGIEFVRVGFGIVVAVVSGVRYRF